MAFARVSALIATFLWGVLTLMGVGTLSSPHAPFYFLLPALFLIAAGFVLLLSTKSKFEFPAGALAVLIILAAPCFLFFYSGGI